MYRSIHGHLKVVSTINWNNFPKPDLSHIIEKVIMKKYLKIMGELLNYEEHGDARPRNTTYLCQRRGDRQLLQSSGKTL
ncbi:hypothetical protein FMK66_02880 [Klebsiella michiganensis]|nr:hypothetical protein [Klebsiella michiganensis]